MLFGILGPLEVSVDGAARPLGGARQRAVLARLLVDVGRVVTADRLVEDVWDGRPPITAAKTLQKYVSELRKVLPAQPLRTAGRGYVLDVEPELVDARRFERLVRQREFEAALGLWRGEVLGDLGGLAFVVPERARLDELRMVAVEGRMDEALAAGRHAEVVGELAELVEAYPLRERLVASYLLALYRSGRQVEALRAYESHRRSLADDIGVEPAAELRQLEAAMLRHDPSLDLPSNVTLGEVVTPVGSPGPRDNLPLPLTSFVGRSDDIESCRSVLSEHRCVTLTGPGGVGKTRLALEVATTLAGELPGGAWLVDLAGVADPDLVPGAVATALSVDVRHAPDDEAALVSSLCRRPAQLVALDNCEHVAERCAELAGSLLASCPALRILATSRRPLGVVGEFVRPVRPLDDEQAVALFTDRARLAGVDVTTPEAAGALAAGAAVICGQLDGLPLAIELAASQVRVLTPAEIAARLDDQLRFRGRASAAPPRQRTLHDMVAWSYELLPAEAQRLYAQLGVFASSMTLAAVEAVSSAVDGGPPGGPPADLLGSLATLVDHSFLSREGGGGSSRYRLLETLRLFALERLQESGELERAHRAHAEYFCRLAAEVGPDLYGPDEQARRAQLDAEEANLHAALRWSESHEPALALRLAAALWPYWDMKWGERHAVAYLEGLLSRPDLDVPEQDRAWGLVVAADLAGNPGDARRAHPWASDAVAAFRALGDERGLACALMALGAAAGNQGALDEADVALDEASAIARRLGDPVLDGQLLNDLSFVASRRGDWSLAAEVNRQELAAWTAVGSRRGQATALRHLAVACRHLGRLEEADALCAEAAGVWRELEDAASLAHVQITQGDIARVRGDLARAEAIYEEVLAELGTIGDRRCTASTFKNLAMIAACRRDHGRSIELFQAGLRLRHELGDEAGLAECLEGLAEVSAADGDHDTTATLLAASAALRTRTGSQASAEEQAMSHRLLATARDQLGPAAFARDVERGRSFLLGELVDYAQAVGRRHHDGGDTSTGAPGSTGRHDASGGPDRRR
jgi:predicted ATPase/DNA-binding SARP family transcriptional activator